MGIDAINYKTLGNNALIANSYLRIRGLSVNKESPGFFLYMYTIQILINDALIYTEDRQFSTNAVETGKDLWTLCYDNLKSELTTNTITHTDRI